jgi:hypothetical protein
VAEFPHGGAGQVVEDEEDDLPAPAYRPEPTPF